MENALTFWDAKGNPILHIIADSNLDSGKLDDLFSGSCSRILKKSGYEVDNTSEEEYKVGVDTENENGIPADNNSLEYAKSLIKEFVRELGAIGDAVGVDYICDPITIVKKAQDFIGDDIMQSTDTSKEHQEVNVDLSIKLWLPIEWDEGEISGYVRGQLPEAYGERITNMINPVEIKDIKQ